MSETPSIHPARPPPYCDLRRAGAWGVTRRDRRMSVTPTIHLACPPKTVTTRAVCVPPQVSSVPKYPSTTRPRPPRLPSSTPAALLIDPESHRMSHNPPTLHIDTPAHAVPTRYAYCSFPPPTPRVQRLQPVGSPRPRCDLARGLSTRTKGRTIRIRAGECPVPPAEGQRLRSE